MLVQRLVRHVLLPRALLPQIEINSKDMVQEVQARRCPSNAHSLRVISRFQNETIGSPLQLPQMPAARGVSGGGPRRQVDTPSQGLCQHSAWTPHFSTLPHSPRTLCRLPLLPRHNRPSRCLSHRSAASGWHPACGPAGVWCSRFEVPSVGAHAGVESATGLEPWPALRRDTAQPGRFQLFG